MSEYQYYVFLAVERPLTTEEQRLPAVGMIYGQISPFLENGLILAATKFWTVRADD